MRDYSMLFEHFHANDYQIGWTEVPEPLRDLIWEACMEGLVVSDFETESYYMKPIHIDYLGSGVFIVWCGKECAEALRAVEGVRAVEPALSHLSVTVDPALSKFPGMKEMSARLRQAAGEVQKWPAN